MLQKIFKKFGYISNAELNKVVQSLRNENEYLKKENFSLKTENTSFRAAEKKTLEVVDFTLGDPIPQDSEARKAYVARVAAFYSEVFDPKLKFMLSHVHVMFEEENNSRDLDLILKGVTYAFRELMKWGKVMINEQVANQNTDVPESDVEKLKEQLNK